MKKKNYIALLTIPVMPKNKEKLLEWLKNVTKEIKKEDYKVFAKPCKFRLMK